MKQRKVRNTAAKGRRKEHQVRDIFIERGYYIIRSAGSLGYFDLIALPCANADPPVAIQCKPKKYTLLDRAKLSAARDLLYSSVRIEAWVIPDGKKPYCEFSL